MSNTLDHHNLVTNKRIGREQGDVLYHFGLDTKVLDFPKEFGGVKVRNDRELCVCDCKTAKFFLQFVCCGGSASRMISLAQYLGKSLKIDGYTPVNLSQSERFVLYRVGPAICVSVSDR